MAFLGRYASKFRRNAKDSITYFTLPFLGVISTGLIINDYLYECTTIAGSSMAPTLSPHHHETGAMDFVLWRKWNATRGLKRGDIVLFHSPTNPEWTSAKRVIGLAGDEVFLDPKRRPEGEVGSRRWDVMVRNGRGRVVVPEGHVWVEGDNWRKTLDSNDYGAISRSLIVGKAERFVWPWRQFGRRVGGEGDGFKSWTRVREGGGLEEVERRREEVRKGTAVWEGG